MNVVATLKGLKCPQCGSENLKALGKKGSGGAAVAAMMLGGAAANLIASSSASKQSGNAIVEELSYCCGDCKKKFQSLPLVAYDEDILPTACTINFTRLGSMVGALVAQIVYLNGLSCGVIKNGKTITFQSSSRWNTMFVLDQYGSAFPSIYRFEAMQGGVIDVKFQRKFVE